MATPVAVIGAGVTGLTTAVVLAENGYEPHIFAAQPAEQCTSGAAAAIWYPYEAEPIELAVAWGMISLGRLLPLSRHPETTGVFFTEFRFFSRSDYLPPDPWSAAIACRQLGRSEVLPAYNSGYAMRVPVMDASRYLPYLRRRLSKAALHYGVEFRTLEDVDTKYDLIVNCTGYKARALVGDEDLVGHRGQIVVVSPPATPSLPYAFVSVENPITYVIPRLNDCVLGGWNDEWPSAEVDSRISERILDECSRVLETVVEAKFENPVGRAGLRPYRKTGVRVGTELLKGGRRRVIHNYGHAGAGFTLSWGCAHKVMELVRHYLQPG